MSSSLISNMSAEIVTGGSDDIGAKLIPAITQCFGVITCGYLAGRMRLISEMDSRGLNTFVGTFALPAMIFLSMGELDLAQVNWKFLLAILISKAIVFIFIVFLTLTLSRKDAASAGLLGIFATMSNDFAIGYPIVNALYSKSHPDYANYLYLVAPISLVFLNPIGFTLMELGSLKSSTSAASDISLTAQTDEERLAQRRRARLRILARVTRNVFLHPVVLMTALGIVANFIFHHNLPAIIADLLQVLGSAFSGTALFVLGLRMVGKVHKLRGAALLIPGILIAVKLLMMPLITREVVSLLHTGGNETETADWATFGFLYGTIPTAAGVFVFATQYNLHVDLVASSMVMCTFVSAPIMFISAKIITLNILSPSDFFHELESFAFDISIAGILVCLWLIVIYILNGKYKLLPHSITFTLIIVQLISSISLLLWAILDANHNWKFYLQMALYSASSWASRCLTPVLAWSLVALQTRGSMKFSTILQLLAIILPTLVAALIIIFENTNKLSKTKQNPNFQYGIPQVAFTLIILIFSFFTTLISLVIHERNRRRLEKYIGLTDDLNNVTQDSITTPLTGAIDSYGTSSPVARTPITDIEDLISSQVRQTNNNDSINSEFDCPERFCCPNAQNGICQGSREREPDRQVLRHQVLLILLLCSLFVSIALNLWTLIMETISGIFVELAFLEATLTFGQPLLLFVIFGLHSDIVLFPLIKCWRRYRYGEITIKLKPYNELNFETRHICEQFITHHRDKCIREIASDKRCGLRFYQEAFFGSALVSWLVEIGLAHDRGEGLSYGARLLEGGIIQHVTRLHHLHDDNTIYTFKIEDLH